jgi:chromosome segregation ATPase
LKSAEKDGFAEAAGEIEELKARLRTFESESGVSNRSVDRNLARESITSLRSKVRELKGDIEAKDAEIEDLRNALSQKSIIEAVNAEKDAVITALQAQINASNSGAPRRDSELAVSTQNDGDIDVLDELQTVAKTLRRENAALRRELEDVDPDVLEECITLSRRVTAQNSLLASYEERLVRYTDQLGIPFTPEARP